ncbi:carbohydrate ABC transporter permease [Paenibacillus koleovorans]|uniref:carbohydrate ABC transporter permease n=1 Tax=Paenibacillus koleovorans TaxID=121608 RepID=UPI000FD95588|nr:carbohydrate ABC transporter permease [Paenibacillus koleovorans]
MTKRAWNFGNIVNVSIISFLALICLFPFINIAAVSLSSSEAIVTGRISFFPVGFTWEWYDKVFSNKSMLQSLWFTVYVTVIYVVMALLMSVFLAYPLSRKTFKGRTFILVMISITLYFSGGLVPTFLVVQKLGMINSMWSLIIPVLINSFNVIIMKSFFSNIPESLIESAVMDGANDFVILFRVVLPLSKAMLATIALFYMVARWNSYSDALFYINDNSLYPLQLKLRELVALSQMNFDPNEQQDTGFVSEGIKSASIIFATLPILLIYPWLQKYFVQGVTLGAIKG